MVLAFNPVNKTAKSDISAHFGADIAFVTTNHSLLMEWNNFLMANACLLLLLVPEIMK